MRAAAIPQPQWADVAPGLSRFGVTYRQFDHWARRGYLGATIPRAPGSGWKRPLDAHTVTRAAALGALTELGFAPSELTGSYAGLLASTGFVTMAIPHLTAHLEFNDDGAFDADRAERGSPTMKAFEWPHCTIKGCGCVVTWPSETFAKLATRQHTDWVETNGKAVCACHTDSGFPCDRTNALRGA